MKGPESFFSLLPGENADIVVGNSKLKSLIALQAYEKYRSPVLIISPTPEESVYIQSSLKTFISGDLINAEKPAVNMMCGVKEDRIAFRASLYRFLYTMLKYKNLISIIDYASVYNFLPDPYSIMDFSTELYTGKKIDRDDLINILFSYGYERADLVVSEGQYCSRGFITDIFVPFQKFPVRIELDEDDLISSMRTFDHLNQRSIRPVSELLLVPVKPVYSFFRDSDVSGIAQKLNVSSFVQSQKINEIIGHYCSPESRNEEFLSCLLYESCIIDYITDDTRIILDEKKDFLEFESEFKYQDDILYNCIKGKLSKARKRVFEHIRNMYSMSLNLVSQGSEDVHIDSRYLENYHGNMERLQEDIIKWSREGYGTLIALPSGKLIKNLKGILQSKGIYFDAGSDWSADRGVHIIKGELSRGFISDYFHAVFLSELEIYGHRFEKEKEERKRTAGDLSSILKLKIDDYVVHSSYGVGRYSGIKTMDIDGNLIDFVEILYRDQDKLFIPVYNLNCIHRYASGEKEIVLDKLKSGKFIAKKKKIKEKLMAYASELMDLYARRSLKKGFGFRRFEDYEEEFDSDFLYEETQDQYRATQEIKNDMQKDNPMDRVMIGDVGFGKTEVVMRAVYLAVLNNKQVAVLVPTTVLAQQHYITFLDRFKGHPVNIAMLSRFTDAKTEHDIVDKLIEGKIDIVIGTHRLLSNDVAFHDLGLLVIDEEHRFGVSHKESLKFLRQEIDTITLTATPIPRTYYMAVSGLRDISFISTPPKDRLSIKTRIIEKQDHLVQNAVYKEISRGGQVFFVHNRVQSIYGTERWLTDLLPGARIAVGHAQMRDSQLERVMLDFIERKFDILLCTTIIESGLDIPNANTILIDNADKLGLAQLYQLRGRVGRTNRQAYAYLIIENRRKMTNDGRLRMQAIMNLSELGAGFQLAGYDLDIRGAGNLVGKEQSGHIEQLGIEFYTKMLKETVEELRGQRFSDFSEVEIKLDKSAYIPPVYISDVSERFSFYKRLSNCATYDDIDIVAEELRDRFGPVPNEVNNVILLNKLRIKSSRKGIKTIISHENILALVLLEQNTIKLDNLLKIVNNYKNKYMLKENQLIVKLKDNSLSNMINECEFLFERIFK